jgi:hypothetical protein
MDWEQVLGQCKGLGSRAKETWERLARDHWQERRMARDKARERAAAAKEAQQHVKHFEDMH